MKPKQSGPWRPPGYFNLSEAEKRKGCSVCGYARACVRHGQRLLCGRCLEAAMVKEVRK